MHIISLCYIYTSAAVVAGTGQATHQLPAAHRRAVTPEAIYGRAAAKPGSPGAFAASPSAGNHRDKRSSGSSLETGSWELLPARQREQPLNVPQSSAPWASRYKTYHPGKILLITSFFDRCCNSDRHWFSKTFDLWCSRGQTWWSLQLFLALNPMKQHLPLESPGLGSVWHFFSCSKVPPSPWTMQQIPHPKQRKSKSKKLCRCTLL